MKEVKYWCRAEQLTNNNTIPCVELNGTENVIDTVEKELNKENSTNYSYIPSEWNIRRLEIK